MTERPSRRQAPFVLWVLLVAGTMGALFALTPAGKRLREGEGVPELPFAPEEEAGRTLAPSAAFVPVQSPAREREAPARLEEPGMPSASPVSEDQVALEKAVASWKYRGFMALGEKRRGRFSRGHRDEDEFNVWEGQEVDGVRVEKLKPGEAELHLGQGRVLLAIQKEELKRERMERPAGIPPAPEAQPGAPRPERGSGPEDKPGPGGPEAGSPPPAGSARNETAFR